MQPMPHPDSWFLDWLTATNLVTREVIVEYQKKLEKEKANLPFLQSMSLTLGALLERDGLLTKEQREAGEKEAARRQGDFAAWRSRTLEEQERRRRGPG